MIVCVSRPALILARAVALAAIEVAFSSISPVVGVTRDANDESAPLIAVSIAVMAAFPSVTSVYRALISTPLFTALVRRSIALVI